MSEAFHTQATDFLTYMTYRGTEYYKIFALRHVFSEDNLAVKEAELLQFIGVDGFNAFINKDKYLELLDAKVKRAHPDAVLPERMPSAHEQNLIKQHEAELLIKEQEIANLQDEITRRSKEVEEKSLKVENLRKDFDKENSELGKKLEAEVKRVTEAKQSLEEKRSRLRDFNAKLVTVEEEKNTMARKHKEELDKVPKHAEKMRKVVEEKDGELVKLGCDLNRTKLQLDALEKETEILKLKRAEELSELESRRKVAQDVDLKQAELAIKLDEVNKMAGDFAVKIAVVAKINTKINTRERTAAADRAELDATKTHFDLLLQEEIRRIRAEIEAELDARFKAVEPLENVMAKVARRKPSVIEREEQCKHLLEEISIKTAEIFLVKEETFAKHAEGMLHAVFNEFSSLHQAVTGRAFVPVPSGNDDAKKGEGEYKGREIVAFEGATHKGEGNVEEDVEEQARMEEVRRKGKQIAVYQEQLKP